MHVVLTPSPSVTHQYRVELPNKRCIDFGTKGCPNYTTHGDVHLTRTHIIEHGGVVSEDLRQERDPAELHRGLLWVSTSATEDWEDVHCKEFWDRWLLWSYPSVYKAKLFMTMRKGVLFMPVAEGMWYV